MLVLDGEPGAFSVAFASDGAQVVAAGPTKVVAWALPGGEQLYCLGPFHLVHLRSAARVGAAVPESGRFLFVAAEQPLAAFALSDGRPTGTATGASVWNAIASRDGGWVVAVEGAGLTRLLGYRCTSDGELHSAWEVQNERGEYPWAFLGASERFVASGHEVITVRDAATGRVLSTTACPARARDCAAASTDGSRLAVGASSLSIWDTATWHKRVRTRSDSSSSFVSLAFHPTRPIIAAIQHEQTLVKFLDADTGKFLRKFQWKLGEMVSVAFSPDGTLAAARSASGKIVVWDVDE